MEALRVPRGLHCVFAAGLLESGAAQAMAARRGCAWMGSAVPCAGPQGLWSQVPVTLTGAVPDCALAVHMGVGCVCAHPPCFPPVRTDQDTTGAVCDGQSWNACKLCVPP